MKPLFFSRGKSEAGVGAQEAACILSTWVRLEEAQRLDHKVPGPSSPIRTAEEAGSQRGWHQMLSMARPYGEAPGWMFILQYQRVPRFKINI